MSASLPSWSPCLPQHLIVVEREVPVAKAVDLQLPRADEAPPYATRQEGVERFSKPGGRYRQRDGSTPTGANSLHSLSLAAPSTTSQPRDTRCFDACVDILYIRCLRDTPNFGRNIWRVGLTRCIWHEMFLVDATYWLACSSFLRPSKAFGGREFPIYGENIPAGGFTGSCRRHTPCGGRVVVSCHYLVVSSVVFHIEVPVADNDAHYSPFSGRGVKGGSIQQRVGA